MKTNMASPLITIGTNFWNLRASFYILHFIDIGTHMSFIKLSSGRFLVVDTCEVPPTAKTAIDVLTENGNLIDAVIGTHPFHTMYFKPFHKMYPNVRYFGCPRHLRNVDIPWAGNLLDHLNDWQAEGVQMRVPDGADIDPVDQNNHLSSVFVFHQESKTIHIDDTVVYHEKNPGFVLRCAGAHAGKMSFWSGGLKKGLKNTKEAPGEFKNFIQGVINDWDFDNIVTAHLGNKIGGGKAQLQETLNNATSTLEHIAKSR